MKLENGATLEELDRTELERVSANRRSVKAHKDIVREGDRPEDVHLVMSGLACRYKLLPDGHRQIMAILIPGDFCDLHVAILGEMDHNIGTLGLCSIVDIDRRTIENLTLNFPRIARALWWATLVDEGTLREWLVSMGQRSADRRMAHLFCELNLRLRTVGLSTDAGYSLPLTQTELGELLGLSTVHVNRTLQELRAKGLIVFNGRQLQIVDLDDLTEFADFNPNYLHLTQRTEARGALKSSSTAVAAFSKPAVN